MPQRLRFLAHHELGEDLLLGGDARVEGLRHRRAHGFERAHRRGEATRHRGDAGLRELQEGFRLRMLDTADRARGASGCPALTSLRAKSRAAARESSVVRRR